MIPESVGKITNRILFCSNCTSTSATLFEIQKIAPRNHAQNQNKKKLLKIRNTKEQRTQRGSERGSERTERTWRRSTKRRRWRGLIQGLDRHALQVPGMAANAFSLFCLWYESQPVADWFFFRTQFRNRGRRLGHTYLGWAKVNRVELLKGNNL